MAVTVICVLLLGIAGVWGSGDKSRILKDLPPITSRNVDRFQEVPKKRNSEYYHGTSPYSHGEYAEEQKKPQPSPGFHYDNNNPYVYEPHSTDGYQKSWKTERTEKFETETVDNPHSNNPENKYIVKSTYKIREKLPFDDHTIGYDQNYEYPLSDIDHDYHKNEKIVDYNSAKTDPFARERYQIPKVKEQQKKKPKEYHYHYEYPKQDQKAIKDYGYHYDAPKQEQKKSKEYHYHYEYPKQQEKKPKEVSYEYKFPSSDYEYHKNVHLVDYYLGKNDPGEVGTVQEEPKSYGFNDVDYGVGTAEKYSDDSFGPSDGEHYHKFKTDGPSYDYL